MAKRYHVHLSDDQRTQLEHVVSRGKSFARVITRARILLKAAENWRDEEIVDAVGSSVATVARVRRRFAQGGLDAVLKDKLQPGRPRVLSSTQAAHLIAVACSPAPAGHNHWPLRLLGQKLVELGYVEHISPETVRQVLEKKRTQTVAA